MKKTFRALCLCLCLGLMLSAAVSANSPTSAELEGDLSPTSIIVYLFFISLSILLTVLIEWVVSLLFLLEASRTVVLTNVVSQVIMHLLFSIAAPLLSTWVTPIGIIIFLELCVFFGEWGYYVHKLVNHSKRKLFCFTLTANLLSLSLGSLGIFLIL